MVESVVGTTTHDIRILLALSGEDMPNYNWVGDVANGRVTFLRIITPDDMPTVHKWNLLELHGGSKFADPPALFMLAADDMIFETKGWDRDLVEHYEALENKIHVYSLRDSRDSLGTPHPIISRDYILAMGYFLPPIMLHWFVDSWTVDIAKSNSVFTHLDKFLLTHDKPSDRGQPDETHNRIRRMGWHERDKYVNDTCQHFLEVEKARLAKVMRG